MSEQVVSMRCAFFRIKICFKVTAFIATQSVMKYKSIILVFLLFTTLVNSQTNVLTKADEYISTKQYAKAVKLLEATENKSPQIEDKLAECYAYMAMWNKAIPIYELLTKKHPKNAEYWFRYGGVLALKARNSSKLTALTLVGKMKSAFIKAAELDAKHIETRWALVDVYLSLPGVLGGSVEKSMKYANELKAISSVDGYISKGYVYEYDDEPEKAKKSYLKGLQALDNAGAITRNQLRYQIGKICGDYDVEIDEGIHQMEKFIDNYTVKDGVGKEWVYYRMARLYRHKSDKEIALDYIEKALAIRDEFNPALKERALIAKMK